MDQENLNTSHHSMISKKPSSIASLGSNFTQGSSKAVVPAMISQKELEDHFPPESRILQD
jgi:hypothetical protein